MKTQSCKKNRSIAMCSDMAETGKIVVMTSARKRGSERNWRRWITPYKFGRDRGNYGYKKICSPSFRNHSQPTLRLRRAGEINLPAGRQG